MKVLGFLAFVVVSANAAATKQFSCSIPSPGSEVIPGGTPPVSTVNSLVRQGFPSYVSSFPSQSGFSVVPGYYYLYPVQQNVAVQQQLGVRGVGAANKKVSAVAVKAPTDLNQKITRSAEIAVSTGTISTGTNPTTPLELRKSYTTEVASESKKTKIPRQTGYAGYIPEIGVFAVYYPTFGGVQTFPVQSHPDGSVVV